LHHSLAALNDSLQQKLMVFEGDPETVLAALVAQFPITHIFWNRCFEPWQIARDTLIKKRFSDEGIQVKSDNQSLLAQPWSLLKSDGTPYKIFTPYWRQLESKLSEAPLTGLAAPCDATLSKRVHSLPHNQLEAIEFYRKELSDLKLLPQRSWADNFSDHATPGELGALERSSEFFDEKLGDYQTGRDFPAQSASSNLSAHIHFGEISVRTLWLQAKQHAAITCDDTQSQAFIRQLGWREFSHALHYHWPEMALKPLKPKFETMVYHNHPAHLNAWQNAKTGFPLIDAGMKELWQTGTMHNRVRMLTASFLVKQLLIDWRTGARWFWDCLFDADMANNNASWQWVAGCGTDAAPYFRIFNPTTQGEKFDKHGDYVKHYLPALLNLPDKYLFQPWTAPKAVLDKAGITLGKDYPMPIVDLKQARLAALAAYDSLKQL
jgi:deoxyribodipyrimidine photo-lyase